MFMYQPLAFCVCNEIFDGKRNSLIVDSALALYYIIRGIIEFLTKDKFDLLLHVSLVYTFYIFFIFRTEVYHEQKALLEGQRVEINKLLSFLKGTIQELPIGIIQADDLSNNIIYFNTWVKSRFKDPSILNNFLHINENSQEQIQKYDSKLYSLIKKVDQGIKLDEEIFQKISTNIPIPKLAFCKIITIVIKDVTQIEELNRKRFTSAYYTTISHELKTPLNALCGSLGLLQPFVQENGSSSYNICMLSLKNLKKLVNSSITLASIENGTFKYKIESTNIKQVIAKSLEHSLYDITIKKLVTEIIINEKLNSVKINKQLFKQIIQILINNSIKYSFNHGKISIMAECEEKIITLKISDEGAGIDSCDLNDIFIPFGCMEKKEKQNATGICLKLSLVKTISEKMGGQISVKSSLGQGTNFILQLPYETDETFRSSTYSQIETKHAQDIMSIPIGYNPLVERPKLKASNTTILEPLDKTVLVVDDNNYNLFILQKLLDILRYKHESAPNGLEAVKKVKAKGNGGYCLIIMDLNMPVLNGFDASLQIISLIEKKEVPQVPIVMLTAQDDAQLKEKCLQAGLKDFFEKPITMEKLKYMVEKYAV